MTQEELTEVFVDWFYTTDLKLDEQGLDVFHDKSLVRERAKDLAIQLKGNI